MAEQLQRIVLKQVKRDGRAWWTDRPDDLAARLVQLGFAGWPDSGDPAEVASLVWRPGSWLKILNTGEIAIFGSNPGGARRQLEGLQARGEVRE